MTTKKTTKAPSNSMSTFRSAPQEHFVEAVPWDGNDFKKGHGPQPELSPVEAAYMEMVDATARYFAVKQWEDYNRNPEAIGNLADYHSEWVRDQLTSGDGTDFMCAVAEVVQKELEQLVLVEQSAQHYLKFFIVKRIMHEQDAPKNSFSDVNFYSEQLIDLRGANLDEGPLCYSIAARMAEIWEQDYKLEINR